MERSKALELCRYYKGEEECPYDIHSTEGIFWTLEKQYYKSSDWNHQEYNKRAEKYIINNPDKNNFLTSDAPIEEKGFVLFANDMINKWDPNGVEIIFEYGKK